jgi:hypothetical protein
MNQIATLESTRNVRHPLVIFATRTETLAGRVKAGELLFLDAVDMAYSAADFAGLVDSYGDDKVQGILAGAFMRCRNV